MAFFIFYLKVVTFSIISPLDYKSKRHKNKLIYYQKNKNKNKNLANGRKSIFIEQVNESFLPIRCVGLFIKEHDQIFCLQLVKSLLRNRSPLCN